MSTTLTKRNIDSDKRLTLSERQALHQLTKCTPFCLSFIMDSVNYENQFIVTLKYKGNEYNPLKSSEEIIPDDYFGGFGSKAIKKHEDKLSYEYINGQNIIIVKFDLSPFQGYSKIYRKVVKRVTYASANNSYFVSEYLNAIREVSSGDRVCRYQVGVDDLVLEIIYNITGHTHTREDQSYTKEKGVVEVRRGEEVLTVSRSIYELEYDEYKTINDIEDDLGAIRFKSGKSMGEPISVTIIFRVKGSQITQNDQNLIDAAKSMNINVTVHRTYL